MHRMVKTIFGKEAVLYRMTDDWFTATQQYFIAQKCERIEFFGKDIALMLRIRDKSQDEALKLEINDYVQSIHGYIKCLSEWIEFHRRKISERRKRDKEAARGPDHHLVRDERGAEEKEGAGYQADEQYALFGPGDGRVRPGGDDIDFWADKMRENPFCPDLDL